MQFQTLWRKLKRNLRDRGTKPTLTKSLLFLAKPLFVSNIYRIYGIRTESILESKSVGSHWRFHLLHEREESLIRQVEDMAEWIEGRLSSKLRRGSLCLVAAEGDRVAAFNLVSVGNIWIPLINLSFQLTEDQAWSEQIYTNHNFRRKGVATELRRLILVELKSRGIHWLLGGALKDNIPSLQLARKTGFTELGDVYYTQFFSRPRWRYEELRNEHNRTYPCLPIFQGGILTFQLPSQPQVRRR